MHADSLLARVELHLPALYLAFALLVTSLLCLLTAPFFGPDEPNQACRAISLAHGDLLAHMGDAEAGARIDGNALAAMDGVNDIRMEWEKTTRDFHDRPFGPMTEQRQLALSALRWAHQTVFVPFGNTAVYPPAFYLPAMAGWRLGEAEDMTIFASLRLARLLCAFTSVGLGWLALRVCACSRWMLIPLLLLPSTLFLNATCSQDAVLLSVAALVAAVLSRPLAWRREFTPGELAVVALLLALCGTARPPYVGMALLVFLPGLEQRERQWRRWMGPGVAFLAVLGLYGLWRQLVMPLGIEWADQADPEAQQAFLRSHPFAVAGALLHGGTEAAWDFVHRGLYVVGWNDLLPHHGAAAVLSACLVVLILLGPACPVRTWTGQALLATCVLAPLAGIALAEYVIWTPPGFYTVYGIQPRYVLPVLPLAVLLSQGRAGAGWLDRRTRGWLLLTAVAVMGLTDCTLPYMVSHAFYRRGIGEVLRLNL